MERLTIKNIENQNRVACRFEDCGTDEEYCPLCVQDDDECGLMQVVTDKLAEYEDRDEKGCFHCEDGFYRDVLGSPCKYNFCPMCGKKLTT